MQRIGATTLLGATTVQPLDMSDAQGSMTRLSVDALRTDVATFINALHPTGALAFRRDQFAESFVEWLPTWRTVHRLDDAGVGRVCGMLAAQWYAAVTNSHQELGLEFALGALTVPAGARMLATPLELVSGILDANIAAAGTVRLVRSVLATVRRAVDGERPGILRAMVHLAIDRVQTDGSIALLDALLITPDRLLPRDTPTTEYYSENVEDLTLLRNSAQFQIHAYALEMRRAQTPGALVKIMFRARSLIDIYVKWSTLWRHGALFGEAAACVRLLRDVAMAFVDPGVAVQPALLTGTVRAELQLLLTVLLRTFAGDLGPYLGHEVHAVGNLDFDDYVELYALVALLGSTEFTAAYSDSHIRTLRSEVLINLCFNTYPALLGAPAPRLAPLDYARDIRAELQSDVVCLLRDLLGLLYVSRSALRACNVLTRLRADAIQAVIDPRTGGERLAQARRRVDETREMDEDLHERHKAPKERTPLPSGTTPTVADTASATHQRSGVVWRAQRAPPGTLVPRSAPTTLTAAAEAPPQQLSAPRIDLALTMERRDALLRAILPYVIDVGALRLMRVFAAIGAHGALNPAALSWDDKLALLRALPSAPTDVRPSRGDSGVRWLRCAKSLLSRSSPIDLARMDDMTGVGEQIVSYLAMMRRDVSSDMASTVASTYPLFVFTELINNAALTTLNPAARPGAVVLIRDMARALGRQIPEINVLAHLCRAAPAFAGLVEFDFMAQVGRVDLVQAMHTVMQVIAAQTLSLVDARIASIFAAKVLLAQLEQIVERVPSSEPITAATITARLPPNHVCVEMIRAAVAAMNVDSDSAVFSAANKALLSLDVEPTGTAQTLAALAALRRLTK